MLELGLGFARGVKILSKVEVLLFRNPSADPASVRSEFDKQLRIGIPIPIIWLDCVHFFSVA